MVREWCSALANGLVRAGHENLAAPLLRGDPPLTAVMCCYAPPPRGQQGTGPGEPLDIAELDVADEVAGEWLRYATGSPRRKDAAEAELALRRLAAPAGGEQSPTVVAVRAAGLLDRIPYFSDVAVGLGSTLRINPALSEVTGYLTRQTVRDEAIARCRALIDADTRVVIAHSLGTAVAYETLRGCPHTVPLFVTLGSPLGLRLFRHRFEQASAWPVRVQRWLNLASPAELVAARPDLGPFYGQDMPTGARLDQHLNIDNTARPHRVGFYLEHEACGRAVADVLGK